jgi:acetoacetate decarboxylase
MTAADEAFPVPSPASAYSTPLDSPLSGPPPARFGDGEVLTVQYRSDPAAIRRLLPEPLQPVNDTVMVQVARWGDVPGLGRDTFEANVMVAARLGDLTGCYSPYFWVTSDRAMVGGREFHGQPKRIGQVSLEHRGDLVVGTLANNGIDFFTGTRWSRSGP